MSSDTQACEGKKYDNNKRALDLLHDVESGTVRYELARRISEALDQAEARGALVTDEIRNKWYQAGRKAALGEAENTAAADARVAELEAELRREVDTNNAINLQQQTATLANTRDVFRGSHVMTLFEKSEARVAELENHLHECQAFFSGGTADGEAYHLDIWRRTTDLLAKTRQIPSTPGPSNIYGHPVELRPAQTFSGDKL